MEELIVWSEMAIVAYVPVEYKDGCYVEEDGRKLRDLRTFSNQPLFL